MVYFTARWADATQDWITAFDAEGRQVLIRADSEHGIAANNIAPHEQPTPTETDVKTEAERRILSIYPIWKQINILREGGPATVTMGDAIDAIRITSDGLCVALPLDYADDVNW